MTLLAKSAAERVKVLERYPDLSRMSTSLVYELVLNRAEEGNYQGTMDIFKHRYFGREEDGTNVRQEWVEVSLNRALALAHPIRIAAGIAVAQTTGSHV